MKLIRYKQADGRLFFEVWSWSKFKWVFWRAISHKKVGYPSDRYLDNLISRNFKEYILWQK